jgi:FKBP-type peptidyl-prolyl cis-trans isomerase (trigger factor)
MESPHNIQPILEGDINENIHDTRVELIRSEINNFINDLQTSAVQNDSHYQEKYSNLYSTSQTLFKMVLTEAKKPNFNHWSFFAKLNPMLDLILKIQKSEISQYKASENVGVLLGQEFIPSNLYKK